VALVIVVVVGQRNACVRRRAAEQSDGPEAKEAATVASAVALASAGVGGRLGFAASRRGQPHELARVPRRVLGHAGEPPAAAVAAIAAATAARERTVP